MDSLNKDHLYSQQATKATQILFILTSILALVSIIFAFVQNLWWLLLLVGIMIFWLVVSSARKTIPVYDLTEKKLLVVDNKKWLQFKKDFPKQVAANGKK